MPAMMPTLVTLAALAAVAVLAATALAALVVLSVWRPLVRHGPTILNGLARMSAEEVRRLEAETKALDAEARRLTAVAADTKRYTPDQIQTAVATVNGLRAESEIIDNTKDSPEKEAALRAFKVKFEAAAGAIATERWAHERGLA